MRKCPLRLPPGCCPSQFQYRRSRSSMRSRACPMARGCRAARQFPSWPAPPGPCCPTKAWRRNWCTCEPLPGHSPTFAPHRARELEFVLCHRRHRQPGLLANQGPVNLAVPFFRTPAGEKAGSPGERSCGMIGRYGLTGSMPANGQTGTLDGTAFKGDRSICRLALPNEEE